jgi:nucleotide-binding universal stress UspA family protein
MELLQSAANKLTGAGGIEVITKLLSGKPEHLLCEYQDQQAIDLTVMGAFSHNRIHDLLLGSFTAKMLLNTHKPLFLLR